MDGRAVRGSIVWTMVLGNLLGAVLTWFYFNFVDYQSSLIPEHAWGLDILYFIVGFSLLSGTGTVWGLRWSRPLRDYRTAGPGTVDPAIVRRRAILVPFLYTAITLCGWVLAGIIWGVLQPILWGTFTPARSLRAIFGITGIAGTVTASSPSASAYGLSATTTATASPTKRTSSRASTGWLHVRPFWAPPYAVGMCGATPSRSAALQAATTPGVLRARSSATLAMRA